MKNMNKAMAEYMVSGVRIDVFRVRRKILLLSDLLAE